MTRLRRIANDYRGALVGLLAALVLAVGGYLLVLLPLERRLVAAEGRAFAAGNERRAAELQERAAARTVSAKDQAARDLERFYAEILPAGQIAARRVTYLHLAERAEDANLRFERRTFGIERGKDSRLARMHITMLLRGSYPEVRRFIHALETDDEFVVISDIVLTQRDEGDASLELGIELETFFRATDGG